MKYTFNSDEENHFKTISNFKECIIRGGEPVFIWKGLQYGVCFYGDKYCIALTNGEQEKICDTPDDVLNYQVGEDRLRDVIRPGVKFCVSDIRQSQEWHWKAGRILA